MNKKKILLSLAIGLTVVFSSCDVLLQTANGIMQSQSTPLTADEVARGLKEALKIGADTATVKLAKNNGYYLDKLVKIELPDQASQVVKYASKVPGLDKAIENVVLQINRSAEDAVKNAAPIFKTAIVGMTISDAFAILNGADSAATHYLRVKTYDQLFELYHPVMQASLNKAIIGGVSAQKTWTEVTGKWNKFANSAAGKLLKANAVNVDLDEYVTKKALDGLFVKVSDQEKLIRTDVNARATTLLKRVFGSK